MILIHTIILVPGPIDSTQLESSRCRILSGPY